MKTLIKKNKSKLHFLTSTNEIGSKKLELQTTNIQISKQHKNTAITDRDIQNSHNINILNVKILIDKFINTNNVEYFKKFLYIRPFNSNRKSNLEVYSERQEILNKNKNQNNRKKKNYFSPKSTLNNYVIPRLENRNIKNKNNINLINFNHNKRYRLYKSLEDEENNINKSNSMDKHLLINLPNINKNKFKYRLIKA